MKDLVQNGIKVTRLRYPYRRLQTTQAANPVRGVYQGFIIYPNFSSRASGQTLIFPFLLKATLPNYSPLNQ